MEKYDVIVVGGGPAGMVAAYKAASLESKVLLIEKRFQCGSKLLITGKGRGNITNTKEWNEFSAHIHPDANFFKSAFYNFSNNDIVSLLNEIGVPTQEERGDRVFPTSGVSSSVRNALVWCCENAGVDICYNSNVESIEKNEELFQLVVSKDKKEIEFLAHSLIIATGGLSYPSTGSTGDGYQFAEQFGHKIVRTRPSLTALLPKNYSSDFYDLFLKNIKADLFIDDALVQSEFGELSCTNGGIEGALGFRLSRRAVKAIDDGHKVEMVIDLKNSLSEKQLRERIARELEGLRVKSIKNILPKLLPGAAITPFVNTNPSLNIESLPKALKCWKFRLVGYVGYERCVITSGGVSLKEISRKTMESKIVKNLYFAGEILDLDADTGGYNLQFAFSSAVLAGKKKGNQV